MTIAADIVPFALQGSAGALAGWECAPPPGAEIRGAAVLAPGFTGSKEDFEALLPLLAESGFRCVAFDQRGQYQSEGPGDPDGYTIDHFTGDLLDVAAQVGRGEPVHLLGHSFGGYVARSAVVARHRAFRSLTLLASGPSVPDETRLPGMNSIAELVESGGQEALWQQMGPMLAGAGVPEAKMDFLHRRILATKKANLIGIVRTLGAYSVTPATVRAAGVPILVAYGTNDMWAPQVFERFTAELGARCAVYEGVGHLPNEEQPQRVRDDLVAFWTGVDE